MRILLPLLALGGQPALAAEPAPSPELTRCKEQLLDALYEAPITEARGCMERYEDWLAELDSAHGPLDTQSLRALDELLDVTMQLRLGPEMLRWSQETLERGAALRREGQPGSLYYKGLSGLLFAHVLQGELAQALAIGERLVRESRTDEALSPSSLLLHLNMHAGLVSQISGLESALPYLEEAMELTLLSTQPGEQGRLHTLRNMSTTKARLGLSGEALALARQYAEEQTSFSSELRVTLGAQRFLMNLELQFGDPLVVNEILYLRGLPWEELRQWPPDWMEYLAIRASLAEWLGDRQEALRLVEEALEFGRAQPDLPFDGIQLTLASRHGDLLFQEKRPQEALAVYKDLLAQDYSQTWDPSVRQRLLANYSAGLCRMGRFEEAEALIREAVEANSRTHGPTHPQTLAMRNILGRILRRSGQLELALRELRAVVELLQGGSGGLDSGFSSRLHFELACVLFASGSHDEALGLLRTVLRERGEQTQQVIRFGSESDKEAWLKKQAGELQALQQLLFEQQPDQRELAELISEQMAIFKGMATDALVMSREQVLQSLDAEGRQLLRRLTLQQSRQEELLKQLSGPGDPEGLRLELQALEEEILQDERLLSQRTLEGSPLTDMEQLRSFHEQLPESARLLQWALWEDEEQQQHLSVFVLSREGLLSWRDLGPYEAISQQVLKLLSSIEREGILGFQALQAPSRLASRQLFETLIQPVAGALEGADQLLFSPAGSLSMVPFAALLDEEERYLGDRFALSLLGSGRDLLDMEERRSPQSEPLILADIDYSSPLKELTLPENSELSPEELLRALAPGLQQGAGDSPWSALPGTRREGQLLHALIPDSTLRTGKDATASLLEFTPGPRWLHIATHGYFSRDGEGLGAISEARRIMLNTGIVLASDWSSTGRGEEERLSAAEIAQLDLRGTELVVLSACETGRSPDTGQSLQGLRRALVLAGSDSQLLSLWKVADQPTQELMVEFYRNLLQGMTRVEALRSAQSWLREDPRYAHPYAWAAFTLSGDWTALSPEGLPRRLPSRRRLERQLEGESASSSD